MNQYDCELLQAFADRAVPALRAARAQLIAAGGERRSGLVLYEIDAALSLLKGDGRQPKQYEPPTIADLARIEKGGGGETVEKQYRMGGK